jgi:hypothetical protein
MEFSEEFLDHFITDEIEGKKYEIFQEFELNILVEKLKGKGEVQLPSFRLLEDWGRETLFHDSREAKDCWALETMMESFGRKTPFVILEAGVPRSSCLPRSLLEGGFHDDGCEDSMPEMKDGWSETSSNHGEVVAQGLATPRKRANFRSYGIAAMPASEGIASGETLSQHILGHDFMPNSLEEFMNEHHLTTSFPSYRRKNPSDVPQEESQSMLDVDPKPTISDQQLNRDLGKCFCVYCHRLHDLTIVCQSKAAALMLMKN